MTVNNLNLSSASEDAPLLGPPGLKRQDSSMSHHFWQTLYFWQPLSLLLVLLLLSGCATSATGQVQVPM